MADQKENRVLIYEDDMRAKFMEGAKAAYDAVSKTYGPKGMNVAIERGFGRPTYTRDGVTVVEQVFFSDRPKNMGAQALAEASRAANNVSGDGSSATVGLTYHLFDNATKAIASGIHPMDVSAMINKDALLLQEELKKLVIPVKGEKQLKEVATVSSGDPLIGQLIAEAIEYVGEDGGILTEKAPITEIEREYMDGYYLQSGFTAMQAGKKDIEDPHVVVSSKRIASRTDMVDILNGIMGYLGIQPNQPPQQIPRIVFIGNFDDIAYNIVVDATNKGLIDAIIIKTPPMYGELGKYLLSDIALYAGCELIDDSTKLKNFVIARDGKPYSHYIGTVSKVVASKSESTLFGDNTSEAVRTRVAEIKDQIENEDVPAVAEKLRDRIAKLEGKIALFKIGAPTDTSKEEIEFRVEDAINSTRHAHREGIVPGGGITWITLSKVDGLSDITRNALRSLFQQLLINANMPAELKLDEALKAKPGFGFNLKESDKLVDVVKAGVVDPYVVAREVVSHATNMAAETIKVGMGIVFSDTEK